jgi:hypothetical protein
MISGCPDFEQSRERRRRIGMQPQFIRRECLPLAFRVTILHDKERKLSYCKMPCIFLEAVSKLLRKRERLGKNPGFEAASKNFKK